MYRVIHEFMDLQDENHIYRVGDTYPREGKETSLERATELMSNKNKIGEPIIEDVVVETAENTEAKPKKGKK